MDTRGAEKREAIFYSLEMRSEVDPKLHLELRLSQTRNPFEIPLQPHEGALKAEARSGMRSTFLSE